MLRVGGKRQYSLILEWRDRDLSDRFSAAVIELVRPNIRTHWGMVTIERATVPS
jgi:hypothetical protein